MIKKFNRLSVFWKVLLVFLLVVLPMYLVSVFVTIKGQNSVRNEILKSAESKGDFYLSSLETQVYNVMRLQLNILNDSDVHMLQRSDFEIPLSDEAIALNSIRDMLRNTKNMNFYIDDIKVFLPHSGRVVTTERILTFDINEYKQYLKFSSVEDLPFCKIGNEYYINMIPEFYSQQMKETYEDKPLLVSLCISKKAVRRSMGDIVGMAGGGAFLLSDGRGLDLSSNDTVNVQSAVAKLAANMPLIGKQIKKLNIDGIKYHVFFNPSTFLHSTLVVYVPESSFLSTLNIFTSWIWLMSILALILVAIFSLWIKNMIATPLDRLMTSLKQVEDGDVDIQVSYSKNDEFGYLYSQFNYLVNKLKQLIGDIYKKELLVKDAEFKQLQYQINPHFLYNSLVVVYGLIKLGDTECALRLTQHLSNYYQYVTKDMPGDVTLEQELNHARDFAEIQNIRFQGRISSKIEDLPDNMKNFYVPRLILQPIVENSYKYGLKNKMSDGILSITFNRTQKYFEINIEDNGDELSEEKLKMLQQSLEQDRQGQILGTGLKNVQERLRIKFKALSGMKVERSSMGGLLVKLMIFMGDE